MSFNSTIISPWNIQCNLIAKVLNADKCFHESFIHDGTIGAWVEASINSVPVAAANFSICSCPRWRKVETVWSLTKPYLIHALFCDDTLPAGLEMFKFSTWAWGVCAWRLCRGLPGSGWDTRRRIHGSSGTQWGFSSHLICLWKLQGLGPGQQGSDRMYNVPLASLVWFPGHVCFWPAVLTRWTISSRSTTVWPKFKVDVNSEDL